MRSPHVATAPVGIDVTTELGGDVGVDVGTKVVTAAVTIGVMAGVDEGGEICEVQLPMATTSTDTATPRASAFTTANSGPSGAREHYGLLIDLKKRAFLTDG